MTPAFEPSSPRKGRDQERKIRLPSPCATFNPFPVCSKQSSRGLCVLLAPALVLVLGLLALVGKSEGITVSGIRAIYPQTASKPSQDLSAASSRWYRGQEWPGPSLLQKDAFLDKSPDPLTVGFTE